MLDLPRHESFALPRIFSCATPASYKPLAASRAGDQSATSLRIASKKALPAGISLQACQSVCDQSPNKLRSGIASRYGLRPAAEGTANGCRAARRAAGRATNLLASHELPPDCHNRRHESGESPPRIFLDPPGPGFHPFATGY
ncbi:hypothetical protein F4680DRAFT_455128 [Xylaria scruposa]|nr:hypothetical protein F4680DRAFT_455128 [Xylaria scruposa]